MTFHQSVNSIQMLSLMLALSQLIGCSSYRAIEQKADAQKKPQIVSSDFSRSHKSATLATKRRAAAVVDENGVPHLSAQTLEDLYFSQGYTHAYFRLWQMELAARHPEATLSEVLGPHAVEADKSSYALGLDEVVTDAAAEIKADAIARSAFENYLAGVHARLEQLAKDRALLPSDYRQRGLTPRKFTFLDLVRLGMHRSAGQIDPFAELRLTYSRTLMGQEMFDEWFPWPNIKSHPLPLFGSPENLPIRPRNTAALFEKDEYPFDTLRNSWLRGRNDTGSNAWTVSPEATRDETAYLANDFHIHLTFPSLYLPIQLSTPQFNFVGPSIVGQPGVFSGTNGKIAIGFVSSMLDIGDWYRLDIDPANPSRYRWNGKWKSFEIETRQIKVLGGKTISVSRRKSAAGRMIPAIKSRSDKQVVRELAYKWAQIPVSRPILAASRILLASKVEDCAAPQILRNIGWLVMTCIDAKGNAGYWLTGQVPKRNLYKDPRLVQLAKSDADIWQNLIPLAELPSEFPSKPGWPMANQLLISQIKGEYLGWNFSPAFRAMEIERWLREKRDQKWDLANTIRMQSDYTDPRIRSVVSEFKKAGRPFRNVKTAACENELLNRLESWDGYHTRDSVGASVATVWNRHVGLRLARSMYGEEAADDAEPLNMWELAAKINGASNHIVWKSEVGEVDKGVFLRQTLTAMCRRGFDAILKSPELFRFGIINSPEFISQTGRVPRSALRLETHGSAFSLFAQSKTHGPAMRAVMKLKAPPEFYFSAAGGPDGDPESQDSGKWLKPWAEQILMPLPSFSAQEIEANHGQ